MALNPQQQAFKEAYLNPESETFGNALRSALRAGYSEEYARTITGKGNDWLADIVRRQEMVEKAEKALDRTLDYIDREDEPALVKIGQDTAKFVTERLKKETYSTRTELTGKDGKDLPTPILSHVSNDNGNKEDPSA